MSYLLRNELDTNVEIDSIQDKHRQNCKSVNTRQNMCF